MASKNKTTPKAHIQEETKPVIPSHLILIHKKAVIFALSFLLIAAAMIVGFWFIFSTRIYPGIAIAGIDVSFLTPNQALEKVESNLNQRSTQKLTFKSADSADTIPAQFDINLSNLVSEEKVKQSVITAWTFGHSRFYLPPQKVNVEIDSITLNDQLSQIAKNVDQPSLDSQLKIEDDQINVTPSQEGLVLNKKELKSRITTYINSNQISDHTLPLKTAYPRLSYESGLAIKNRLDQIKVNPLKLTFEDQSFTLDFATLLSLIDLNSSDNYLVVSNFDDQPFNLTSVEVNDQETSDTRLTLNKDKTDKYLQTIALAIDQNVQEPLFNYDPSSPSKVSEFSAPQEGRKLDKQKTEDKIALSLVTPGQNTITLPVQTIQPKNKLANDLGIKELIGSGISDFSGSIPNRIYNVNLAASRINGVLVAPGDTFSFDNTIGDISAATGYKQAYVIKSGRTVLDDGGGVCQVSTTLFRAVLNSGLPVVARTAHAYRVHYYEEGGFAPGIDATVFYPSVDFKFKNDSPAHILIQAHAQGTTLYVDFYGTSDGRVATVSKPIVTSVTPAPPELRQDDPTLPKGTVKQVDFAAAGANVIFSRTVKRDGQTIIQESFRSNYKPWQAVYLVGTKEG